MLVLGQRKDDRSWQVLDVKSVNEVRPEGAWSTVLEVIQRDGHGAANEVIEYHVPRPQWEEVRREREDDEDYK